MTAYEVIVCGGSLAGSATAIRLLQKGITPLILEKKRFPRPKLCGEFLGPDSFEPLRTLGVWDTVKQHACGPIHQAVFYTMSGKTLGVNLSWMSKTSPYGLGISRETLDQLLLEHARSQGAVVLAGYRVNHTIGRSDTSDAMFCVTALDRMTSDTNWQQSFFAPVVVDATGYHGGLLLEGEGEHHALSQTAVLGVKINVEQMHSHDDKPVLRMFFFPGGYGGIQPVDGGKHNLCMLVSSQYAKFLKETPHHFLRETMGKNPVASDLLEQYETTGAFQTTVFNIRAPRKTGLLAVGDAMLTVDPATGSGMSIALQTGVLAGDVIAEGLRRKMPYEAIQQEFQHQMRALLGRRLAFLRLFRPYLFSTRMQNVTSPVVKPLLPVLTRTLR